MKPYDFAGEPSGFTALARQIVASPLFACSSYETEKNSIVTSVMDELAEFSAAAVPAWEAQTEYSLLCNKCMEEDGHIQMTGALRFFMDKQSRLEQPLFDTENRLEAALQTEFVEGILEALHLVGVTDEGVKAEICRVVIQGGIMLDGKGFMEGQPVQSTETERKAA